MSKAIGVFLIMSVIIFAIGGIVNISGEIEFKEYIKGCLIMCLFLAILTVGAFLVTGGN